MPVNRFFTHDPLEKGCSATILGAEHHHLAHVIRIKEGDEVEIANGKGLLATAVMKSVGRQKAEAFIQNVIYEPPPKHKRIIIQAFPKANRLEFILEKCTELGMDALWLFPGEKSEKREIKESQLKRMETIVVSAMKQSGRLYLPQILVKEHFSKWKDPIPGSLYYGDVHHEAPTLMSVVGEKVDADHFFFIGPESGFSEKEEKALQEIGAVGVKLNQNILRTDTAPMVALSIIGNFYG
ncbi:MAG: RsmE family RNA methyltransferase [Chlamydiota bacterium]